MKKISFLLLVCAVNLCMAQVKNVWPTTTRKLNLSEEGEKAYNEIVKKASEILIKMENNIQLTKEEQTLWDEYLNSDVEIEKESYWDILGAGCSWYCGGGPKTITASSSLEKSSTTDYEAENAHDLNYKTAWVEGVPGNGIGEYLLYTFEPQAPRVTNIIIVNGYVKNEKAYYNNARVKKLKVYYKNKPYAIFNLKDERGEQNFKLEAPLGNDNSLNSKTEFQEWTLKFEILEVYPGNKYDDTVISEIYFDGIDVHCFAKGTKVLMANGTEKNIENITVGNTIACYNPTTQQLEQTVVEQLDQATHNTLVTYTFASGKTITATHDHPFYCIDKGWASLAPQQSLQYMGYNQIAQLAVGDVFATATGTDTLIAIQHIQANATTYTITKLSNGNSFIANGLVVGTE